MSNNNTLTIKNREHADHSRDEVRQDVADSRTRVPITGPRNILNVIHEIPGKHLCWINDDERDSVALALMQGYEFVKSNMKIGETTINRPAKGDTSVVWKNVGLGMVAYLMAIDQELYDADMAADAARRAIMDKDLYKGTNQEGLYTKMANINSGSATKD